MIQNRNPGRTGSSLKRLACSFIMIAVAGCSSAPPSNPVQGDGQAVAAQPKKPRDPGGARRGVADIACLVLAVVCVPATLVFTVYHVGRMTSQNYSYRNSPTTSEAGPKSGQ